MAVKMKYCPRCQQLIPNSAKICPACGAKQKSQHGCLTAFLIALGVVVVLFVILLAVGSGSPSESEQYTSLSKTEYISQSVTVSYDEVARNPDTYKGKLITFTGEVSQVIEGSTITLLIDQTNPDDEWASDTWYVTYKPAEGESRILEGDTITVYGECVGTETYQSVLGAQITIPSMIMKYYE